MAALQAAGTDVAPPVAAPDPLVAAPVAVVEERLAEAAPEPMATTDPLPARAEPDPACPPPAFVAVPHPTLPSMTTEAASTASVAVAQASRFPAGMLLPSSDGRDPA